MVFLGLSLVGLPGAGLIGLLAGLLNIVPFIGTVVPIIPAILLAIGGGWVQVILVLVVFIVANQIAYTSPPVGTGR
jgi:predicted PurR-regulated permease PerM